ncbi:MAG: sigma factor-like helix-turn-helix DNA-binding protein [Acidimicrobiales bacterium]
MLGALAGLPPKQQACVVLRHLGDLPYDEIATQLGISPAAARRNTADGIAALRRNPMLQPNADLEVTPDEPRRHPDRPEPPDRPVRLGAAGSLRGRAGGASCTAG